MRRMRNAARMSVFSSPLPAPQKKHPWGGALVAQEEGDWLSPKRRAAVILRSSSSLPLRRRSGEPPLIRVFFKGSPCPTKKHPFGCSCGAGRGRLAFAKASRRRHPSFFFLAPSPSSLARTPVNSSFLQRLSLPHKKTPFRVLLWRRKRDSNPRGVAPKRFSRPPRYDRFDIPAYYIIKFLRNPIPNGLTLAQLAIPSLSLLTRLASL